MATSPLWVKGPPASWSRNYGRRRHFPSGTTRRRRGGSPPHLDAETAGLVTRPADLQHKVSVGRGGRVRASATRLAIAGVTALLVAAGCSGGTDRTGGRKPDHVLVLNVLNTRGAEDIAPFLDRLAQVSGGTM